MKKIHLLIKKIYFSLFYIVCFVPTMVIADDEFSRACKPLSEFQADGTGDNFLLKEAYITMSKAFSSVAKSSWDAFATSLQGVVGIGTAIYIAVYTLKNLGSFSQQDVAAYLSGEKGGIIPICVKMAIIVCLLGDQEVLYTYLISPVVVCGMEIGELIAETSTIGTNFSGAKDVDGLFQRVILKAQEFNDQSYKIVAMGRLFLCMAFLPDEIWNYYYSLVPFGAVFYIFGWLILLFISFYLLDVLFRLGVACIILPLAIACAISKLTSTYTKKTWGLFVNVTFNFMILGVVINFVTEMLLKSVAGGSDALKDRLGENTVLNIEDAEAIAEMLDVKSFILVALCCMIAQELFQKMETLVDTLSGTTSVGKAAQSIGKELGEKTSGIAKKPVEEAGNFVGAAAQEAKTSFNNSRPVRAAQQFTNSLKNQAKLMVGLDDNAQKDIWGDKLKNAIKNRFGL